MELPNIIAVVGTTASGKTDLAIELAKQFDGELISCDSRQMYKEMEIGANKDRSYPHHLYDISTPDKKITVADFQEAANTVIQDILKRGKLPILVGGTALYVTAILENYQIPEGKGGPLYNALLIAPDMPREEIYRRVNQRVDLMMEQGLLEEVKALGEKYGFENSAMTGHAYQQLGWYLQGKMTLEEALEETKKATRHYVKRQFTWWGKPENQPGPHGHVHWVKNTDEAKVLVKAFLN